MMAELIYGVKKVIAWCLSPIGFFYLGLLAAWLLRRRCPRTAKVLLGLALGLFWILGAGVTTLLVGVPLERPFVHPGHPCGEIASVPDVEEIVLLGGGVGAHEECGAPELFQAADRVRQAALFWKACREKGRAPKIFCTGGGVETGTTTFLADLGVPRSAVDCSSEPRTTAEEAAYIRSLNIRKIALVTSAWHMRRARLLFERAGFEVTPVPADFEMTCAAESEFSPLALFPSVDGLLRNSAALKEWVALLGYSILR